MIPLALLWSRVWPTLLLLALFMCAMFLIRFIVRRYRLM